MIKRRITLHLLPRASGDRVVAFPVEHTARVKPAQWGRRAQACCGQAHRISTDRLIVCSYINERHRMSSSVLVPRNFEVTVAFPDRSTATINLFQMKVMADAVAFRAKHGRWNPHIAKLKLTKTKLCERFHIDPAYARTYSELAETMLECYDAMMAEFTAAQ